MYDFEYYTKENFIKKLDNAILFKYGNSTNDTDIKRNKAFYDDFERKYPNGIDIRQATRSWRSFSKNNLHRLPQITQLMQICDVLECDIDYFLTPQESFRKEIFDISSALGLDYYTIKEFFKLSTTEKHIIDALFSRTNASHTLIETIKEMVFYSHPNSQNKTKITLDEGLTNRDSEYSELENKLNESSIADIFSFRLGIEMNYIIESLIRDTDLSNEIYTDYKNKHFKKHIKPLADSELPKIIRKPDGTLMIDIDDEIEKMETTIIERLKHRDKNNVKCDYRIDWLHQCDDFINEIKAKRNLLNSKDYLAWLKEITNLTS